MNRSRSGALVPASFIGGALPVGVASVRYTLDLTATTVPALDGASLAAVHRRLLE